ncbi:hypothetical protein Btru_074682 [Bulinus truncatus]|nr:hypothetical protein Btru_074682 [Bulinus truncatus]
MNARLGTCVSAPPAVDTEPLKVQRREEKTSKLNKFDQTNLRPGLITEDSCLDVPESDSVVASAVELERSAEPLRSPAQLLEPPSIDLLESYPVVSQGRQPSDSAHKDPS